MNNNLVQHHGGLDGDGLVELQRHRLASESDPDNGRLVGNLINAGSVVGASGHGAIGNGDGNGDGARVVLGANSNGSNSLAVSSVGVASGGLAVVKRHTVQEVVRELIVSLRNHGPGGQAGELLYNGLDPGLEQGQLASLAAHGDDRLVDAAQVGLVEHVRIGLEVQKDLNVGRADKVNVLGVGAAQVGDLLVLVQDAGRGGAVKVHLGRESRHNPEASIAIGLDGALQRPVLADGVAEEGTGVVTNNVLDAVVHPGTDSVTVVQTGNGRGNDSVSSESGSLVNAHLSHPGLVELDLASSIVVCGVVQGFVCKGVGDVAKGVEVVGVAEPVGKRVKLAAGVAPAVLDILGRPNISASANGLDKFNSSVNLVRVLNSILGVAELLSLALVSSGFNVAVTVVAELEAEVRASRHAGENVLLPCDMDVKVLGVNLKLLVLGLKHGCVELQVVDLGAEVQLALANKQTASHPVDVGVLQVARSKGPLGSKGSEPDEGLAVVDLVDDGADGSGVDATSRLKHGPGSSGGSVCDLGLVVVQTVHVDRSIVLETSSRDSRGVDEAHTGVDAVLAAAIAVAVDGGCAKLSTRELVYADHADTESILVCIELVPLICGKSTVVVAGLVGAVVVDETRNSDDGSIVAISSRRVELGQANTALGNKNSLPRNAVAVKARAGAGNVGIRASKNKNSATNGSGSSSRGTSQDGGGRKKAH